MNEAGLDTNSNNKLDYKEFLNPETEAKAVENHAFAIASLLEALSIVQLTFHKEGFPETSREAFEKCLRKCATIAVCCVPTQWQPAVMKLIAEASKEGEQVTNATEEPQDIGK